MARLALIAAATAALALAGCASRQALVESREHLLAAAGFRIQPATTAQQQAELARLPPHQLVWQQRDGTLTFLYADPLVCHCLFVGSEQAYQTYRQMEFQQQITEANRDAAQMNLNAAAWWPWGWGQPPGYWWR